MEKRLYETIKQVLIILLLYLVFQSLYKLWPKYLYMWKWVSDRFNILIIFILILNFHKKFRLSSLITLANIIGIILGEFLGWIIVNCNSSRIILCIDKEELYRLEKNPGVVIYFVVVFTIFIAYAIRKRIKKSRKNLNNRA